MANFYLLVVSPYPMNGKKFLPEEVSKLKSYLKKFSLIVVYGNDAGVIQKNMGIDLKKDFHCLNYIRIVNRFTKFKKKRIYDLENALKIKRNVKLYKHSIQRLFDDWKRPERRKIIYEYNMEDCKNLYHIFEIIQRQICLSFDDYLSFCMVPK
jgi:uncharacterized protein YprB with RNaseH-like and TPR domain